MLIHICHNIMSLNNQYLTILVKIIQYNMNTEQCLVNIMNINLIISNYYSISVKVKVVGAHNLQYRQFIMY